MNRREFASTFAAPLCLAAAQPPSPARRRALKRFKEIAASLYAWDLADEGVEPVLETPRETTGANSTYLVALMHWEKRPLTDFYYPHNARRKTYFPEDSRAYWRPNLDHYKSTRIKPRLSDREELKGQGLAGHSDPRRPQGGMEDRRRDLPHGARSGTRARLPDGPVHRPGDQPWGASGAATPVEKTVGTVLGGCWCSSCESAAKAQGVDFKSLRKALLPVADALDHPGPAEGHHLAKMRASNITPMAALLRHPELFEWLKFRCASPTALFRDVHAAITRIKPKIDLRLNAYIYDD